MSDHADLETKVLIETLKNAVKYEGKANPKAIMGKILGKNPDLRPKAKEIGPLVGKAVKEVNALPLETQRERLLELAPKALEEKKHGPEEKELPPLPNVDGTKKIVMRLAPYPSGALHIGNARMIVLNDYYVKRYGGKLILAFDDTIGAPKAKLDQPGAKFVIPEAYDLIREGLKWLGVHWHEEVYKSDRLDLYYDYCKILIEKHEAYVCTCDPKTFKEQYKNPGAPCPHRDLPVETNLAAWDKMLDGTYREMEAVVRLKTGMDQPDPAVRDQIIMRISEAPHPRVGTKYRVWPMLEFSWGVDDHELGVTHIIRGADLIKEDFIEDYLWDYFKWPKAEFLHYGRMRFENMNLSKTQARENVQAGNYEGWADPRIWSLQSLAKRGFRPEALRETLLEMGLSMTPIKVSPEILYAKNQKLIDSVSPRFFFVADPVKVTVMGIPKDRYIAKPLLLPPDEDQGHREIPVEAQKGRVQVYIPYSEAKKLVKGAGLRLKDLFNIRVEGVGTEIKAQFHSEPMDRSLNYSVTQWVPVDLNVPCEVLEPDGNITRGLAESTVSTLEDGKVVQFERFGFVRLVNKSSAPLEFYFTH